MPNETENKRVIAFDLGLSHIGVAIYIPGQGVHPLEVISFKDRYKLYEQLVQIIRDYETHIVVIGDMGSYRLPEPVDSVIKKIKGLPEMQVCQVSEKLSTFEGKQRSIDQDKDHAHAASIILENYLEGKQE